MIPVPLVVVGNVGHRFLGKHDPTGRVLLGRLFPGAQVVHMRDHALGDRASVVYRAAREAEKRQAPICALGDGGWQAMLSLASGYEGDASGRCKVWWEPGSPPTLVLRADSGWGGTRAARERRLLDVATWFDCEYINERGEAA